MKRSGSKLYSRRMSLNLKLKLTPQGVLVMLLRVERDIELIINHFHPGLEIRVLP